MTKLGPLSGAEDGDHEPVGTVKWSRLMKLSWLLLFTLVVVYLLCWTNQA